MVVSLFSRAEELACDWHAPHSLPHGVENINEPLVASDPCAAASRGATDEEFEQAIVASLLEAGASGAQVDVQSDEAKGMTRIDIGVEGMPDSISGEQITMEITR